jgi:hypothetical protein|tara:strand:+ start:10002 stop:10940 length:939 start_codon:yes stop_codon:yes gene_type:complete
MDTQLEQVQSFYRDAEFLSDEWQWQLSMLNSKDQRREFIMNSILDENVNNDRGATTISKQLVGKYGSKKNPKHEWAKDGSIPPKITIQRAIEKNREEDKEYDVEKCKESNPQLYPYLRKMQLLNDSAYSQKLFSKDHNPKLRKITTLFAKSIERCLYSFNDPLGEKVDLMAQWVVAREYYMRDRIRNKETADLDAILDYTPWLDTDRDPTATLYYSEYIRDKIRLTPRLHHAMPIGSFDGQFKGTIHKDSYIFSIYAQLRLPFYIVFIDEHGKGLMAVSIPTDEDRKRLDIKSPEELRKRPLAKPFLYLRTR